jgi:hypothetical protein
MVDADSAAPAIQSRGTTRPVRQNRASGMTDRRRSECEAPVEVAERTADRLGGVSWVSAAADGQRSVRLCASMILRWLRRRSPAGACDNEALVIDHCAEATRAPVDDTSLVSPKLHRFRS